MQIPVSFTFLLGQNKWKLSVVMVVAATLLMCLGYAIDVALDG